MRCMKVDGKNQKRQNTNELKFDYVVRDSSEIAVCCCLPRPSSVLLAHDGKLFTFQLSRHRLIHDATATACM